MSAESKLPEPQASSITWSKTLPTAPALAFGLVLLTGALAPLLFSPWHHNAIELPKAIASRTLAGLALLCLAYLLADRAYERGQHSHPASPAALRNFVEAWRDLIVREFTGHPYR